MQSTPHIYHQKQSVYPRASSIVVAVLVVALQLSYCSLIECLFQLVLNLTTDNKLFLSTVLQVYMQNIHTCVSYCRVWCWTDLFHLVEDVPTDEGLKGVLSKLCDLYGLWSLDKHLAVLYQG